MTSCFYAFLVAVVGFERTNYTVNETDGFVEVCVVVTTPPPTEELVFPIVLRVTGRNVTATGMYVIMHYFRALLLSTIIIWH